MSFDLALAQDSSQVKIKSEAPVEVYPKFKVGGILQAAYLYSSKNNVDIGGLQHSDGEFVNNSFDIKRMRVSMNAQLSEKLSVVTLVNLADFRFDTKSRVLENAYMRYKFNNYFNVEIGQFRPAFGFEDTQPVDIVKSIDFSNAYYFLANNGWQSFQIGAGFSGAVDIGKVVLNYSASMTNGNGKNRNDNNDGKHFSSRVFFDIDRKTNFKLGLSAGVGSEFKQSVNAFGVECTYQLNFTDKFCLQLQTEAFRGLNQHLYFSTEEAKRLGDLDDYVFKGFYVLPNLRYVLGKPNLEALEFSCRYEYLDANSKLNSNPRKSLTPMVSVEFLKNYGARLQLGVQVDQYKTNILNTKTYDANLYFLQLQCRLQ